ncbi:MAG TPA: thioredoxin-disulfide reductase [Candidatus Paceibacterota bacterium]|nr:thioredoxin-disulfide reductase [Candidatus Paceibacterota bacterium]
MDIKDLIIIGGGPAGLTAGIYAGRAKLKTLLFTGSVLGGQLMLSEQIDDFPGFPEKITGPELIKKMAEQVKKFDVEMIEKNVISVDFKKRPFVIKTDNEEYLAKSVIVATGASAKWLGLKNEQELIGHGISACAVCDGFFFKDKVVGVVGGGDSAMENAITLTKYAKKVFIIHRRNELKASKKLQEEVLSNSKIEFIYNNVISEIKGKDSLEGIYMQDVNTQEKRFLEIDGLFISIGYKPVTDIFQNQLDLDNHGYIKVKENTQTSADGVFAAGDVCDTKYRQAITASGLGAMALLDVDKWLR